MGALAFPLQWPEGWKRTASMARRRSNYKVTPERATNEMLHSLQLLGADRRTIILSTNIPVRQDGLPYANHRAPEDPGVAVYWNTKALGERVIACDKWDQVHANIRAIGLAVDGLRAMDRAGATQILERAFSAFGALPAATAAPVARPWWEVFDVPQALLGSLSLGMIEARYRELAAKAHPDRGGSQEAMVELNFARDQARQHFGEGG
jgi:hypothetical protein